MLFAIVIVTFVLVKIAPAQLCVLGGVFPENVLWLMTATPPPTDMAPPGADVFPAKVLSLTARVRSSRKWLPLRYLKLLCSHPRSYLKTCSRLQSAIHYW